jgi:hypothetical protein
MLSLILGKRWATRKARALSAEEVAAGEGWLPPLVGKSRDDTAERGLRATSGEQTVGPGAKRWLLVIGLLIGMGLSAVIFLACLGDLMAGPAIGNIVGTAITSLVTLALGSGLVYAFLAMLNPKVWLTFEPRIVALDETLGLRWRIAGRAEKFARFSVKVEGLERASYTRGTDTITEEEMFFERVIHEEGSADGVAGRDPIANDGEVEFAIPAGAMHSLSASHNAVIWRVVVVGEVPRWPDVKDTHEFAVVPPRLSLGRRGSF